MGMFGSKTDSKKGPEIREDGLMLDLVKRCPECFVSLPIDAKECFSCQTKVGPPDKHGKAKKRVDWFAYLACILSLVALFMYCRWAFF